MDGPGLFLEGGAEHGYGAGAAGEDLAALEAQIATLQAEFAAKEDELHRRIAQQEARERSREALFDLTIKWLQLASRPENSPAEKWLLFLSDVWVVGVEKVKNSALIYQHQDYIRPAQQT